MTDARHAPSDRDRDRERLACPRCGCPHLPVEYTRHREQTIIRKRRCRHCGRAVITRERA